MHVRMEPYQKYHLGTVSNRSASDHRYWELKLVSLDSNISLCFCDGSKHLAERFLANTGNKQITKKHDELKTMRTRQ